MLNVHINMSACLSVTAAEDEIGGGAGRSLLGLEEMMSFCG